MTIGLGLAARTFNSYGSLSASSSVSKEDVLQVLRSLQIADVEIDELSDAATRDKVHSGAEFLEWLERGSVDIGEGTHRIADWNNAINATAQQKELADIVVSGLKAQWSSFDASTVAVKQIEKGLLNTFSLSASPQGIEAQVFPSKVSLVPRGQTFAGRCADSARILASAHGVAPRRICNCGTDWLLETCEGTLHPHLDTSEDWERWGTLLAKVHRLPVNWFEFHRDQLTKQFPCLFGLPPGSRVWSHVVGRDIHFFGVSEAVLSSLMEASLCTQHPVTSRVVTSLCNFQPLHVVTGDSGPKIVNFDAACVTHAVQDLSAQVSGAPTPEKHAFLRRYMEEMGADAANSEVEKAMVDCQLASLFDDTFDGCLLGPQALADLFGNTAGLHSGDAGVMDAIANGVKSFIANVRASSDLQKKIVTHGVLELLRSDPLYDMIAAVHESHQRSSSESGRWIGADFAVS
uniref:Uncharacterized protein n=1 Tax=Noctiluca scintillans TaxID=2966 RepID=A0A7S1A3Z5_NOCSC|mmetsp:Transcript_29780/g.79165  ORF Transcript_29780/g.79165 Transcript_29780/m.79165 type:complete len:462 (+) Transcript_29780:84-1469(+)